MEMAQNAEETTGRYLVTLEESAAPRAGEVLSQAMGIDETLSAEGAGIAVAEHPQGQAIVFERLGVAVVAPPPEAVGDFGAAAAESKDIVHFEPERVVYAIEAAAAPAGGEEDLTWGLQAIDVMATTATGAGVEVAVLDTGVDVNHPDLAGRTLATQSFVAGQDVQDGNGHGTHCIGTACGSVRDDIRPRYGVAYEASIFAGKVLGNNGSGVGADILAGIEAAIDRGSRVASLSLGGRVNPGAPYSEAFEKAALRARGAGTLIVAAAGNDSDRPGRVSPVSHPANCPSILAVAAVDQAQQVAFFSNQGSGPLGGGRVDIAGPGVGVHSMAPMPKRYATLSGTSMATPHVAGVVALLAQVNAGASPDELADLMVDGATKLTAPEEDVGAGLVQAPR